MPQGNPLKACRRSRFRLPLKSVLLVSSLAASCVPSTVFALDPLGADVIKAHDLQVSGLPSVTVSRLPKQLVGPMWGLTKEACNKGGYDISTSAGQKVNIIRYRLACKTNRKLALVIFSKNDRSVCGYVVDENLIPGILPITHPYVKSLKNQCD
ncbi:hypothetical protein [Geomonas oryzae]|uniref:hypothetical protein n=1 Tax=Geomonas oryzae TaxID=2364273 RepID=UPI00100ABBF9|nr:hypothetical protein [Geomonas oryzae]